MALLATDAIVLHAFDYLESSRILRLVTREAGVRSVLAKGARRSSRRFGSALDLFAQGSAQLYAKPGRDLDTLGGFDVTTAREGIAADLGRFAGASAVAELTLRFGRDAADPALFDARYTDAAGVNYDFGRTVDDSIRRTGFRGAERRLLAGVRVAF
jgi:DNA repair protein RecO (recombination protein O)